jgi:hypothetical protein
MSVYHREMVWLENSLAMRKVGQVQKQVVEGHDPHVGNGLVCEGDR